MRFAGEGSSKMREGWARSSDALNVTHVEAVRLLAPVFPDANVLKLVPLAGGFANTNIGVVLDRAPGRVLLRLYQRDPRAAFKESAIARLVAPRVPVAQFLHIARDNDVNGRAYAILDFVEGATLEALGTALDEASLRAIAGAVGGTLAGIHSFSFGQAGFFDDALNVMPFGGAFQLTAFLHGALTEGPGAARVESALAARVIAYAERNEGRMEEWSEPRLVHFDFNPSNILLRHENGAWRVAAVLDWEFAASASPANDFGNIMRPPLGRRRGFADALALGYRRADGYLPNAWREIAQLADLTAWAEFLTRPEIDDAVVADARTAFETATGGNL